MCMPSLPTHQFSIPLTAFAHIKRPIIPIVFLIVDFRKWVTSHWSFDLFFFSRSTNYCWLLQHSLSAQFLPNWLILLPTYWLMARSTGVAAFPFPPFPVNTNLFRGCNTPLCGKYPNYKNCTDRSIYTYSRSLDRSIRNMVPLNLFPIVYGLFSFSSISYWILGTNTRQK